MKHAVFCFFEDYADLHYCPSAAEAYAFAAGIRTGAYEYGAGNMFIYVLPEERADLVSDCVEITHLKTEGPRVLGIYDKAVAREERAKQG